ncbi:MAG: DUF2764 family protein [Candidatus Omnitrophica bacterium]|nr:DUF2764 family protein [Candidatus Omnitrophota bacterium]
MREYYYLIASLPMLEFGTKMPISYVDFLKRSREQLESADMGIIERIKTGPFEDTEDPSPTFKEWKLFARALRNEIARYRAARTGKDPLEHIRGGNYPDPFVSGFAHWAVHEDSPIEAELYLDRARWEKIEELEKGHYFDIDFLVTYALKLQILERWDRINSEGGMALLQALLSESA